MASKVIHICDRCKSYIDSERDVWPIKITIDFPVGRNAYATADKEPEIVAGHCTTREICTQCAKEVTETYMLDAKDTAAKLFEGFKPTASEEAYLQEQIKNYWKND